MGKKIFVLFIITGILPLFYALYSIDKSREFFKPLLHFFGNVSAIFLVVLMVFGALSHFFKQKIFLQKILFILGLYVLMYASLHLGIYIFVEVFWDEFFSEVFKRIYLLLGFIAFLLIFFLSFSSIFNKAFFFKISSLSYVAALLIGIHILLGQKIPSMFSFIIFAIFLFLICMRLLKKG
ncbi:hypothetical protein [Helicobacter anatolicus]|uniref:hypothetical protein n=1 Tax=Helicobacter anatolicus TaxID=2905874 RepID=UPI001E33E33B|nr:hypothetical protein [Helicobacter anatolicus]MCE3038839.1 hypothetical protein [Helicobacter anatolicus]